MRQLPATSNTGGTSTTENSRSRSQQASESSGTTKILSNGSLKEPILTRSKSRLRVGRRLSGRSPKKPESSQKTNEAYHESTQRRKPAADRSAGSSSATQASSLSSPKNDGLASERSPEKMYAKHYKSYRRLNGIKSRRGERSSAENHSHTEGKDVQREDSTRDSRRNPSRRSVSKIQLTRNRTRNAVNQNGVGSPSSKGTRCPSNRIRQLVLKKKKQLSRRRKADEDASSVCSSSHSKDNDKELSQKEKDKVAKRRSALWVLNCEAESFLFGETAADKHEVELPPLAPPSPPPKKRRKWRVTELAHLLEKSPILETKLRKSSSSESGSDMQREASPPSKRLKTETQRTPRRVKNTKHREKTPDNMCSTSSKSVKGRNHEQVLSPKPQPELLSPIPFLYSPDSVDHEAKTVQFQRMLANVNWGYSFEEPPVNEPWYPAFARSTDSIVPYTSFVNPLHEPVTLPYEMDKPLIRRSRCKPVRNSRKSPRCHASTLAILSSERPTRSTRSSINLDTSPSSSVNNLQSESTLSTLLLSPAPNSTPASTSTPSTSRFSPPKCIPSTSRRRYPSSPRPNPSDSKKELGAAQYLWDSIQFLSDPYVVTLLAGEDPDATYDHADHPKSTKSHRCNNNNYVVNNCPVKHMVNNFETSARKASLRSGDSSASSTDTSVYPNNLNNSRLVSVPKGSPRNHSHGTNQTGVHNLTSPPVSPSSVSDRVVSMNGVTRRFTSRSPPLSPPTKQTVCHPARLVSPKNSKGTNAKQSKLSKVSGSEGGNGLINHEKSSKKSPIVLVTNLYSATAKTKLNSWEEESLFIGDGLPPLPSWPV